MTQILLIEDSNGDAWLIRDVLMQGPVPKEIHRVPDGDRALRFLRRQGEYANAARPDLILLDLNLPGKDGFEILQSIKTDPALRMITVIVLTTSDAVSDVNAAYDLNANCYVVKPLDLAQFTQAMRGIEEFWLGMAMLPDAGNERYSRRSARNTASGEGPVACLHPPAKKRARPTKRRVYRSGYRPQRHERSGVGRPVPWR